MDTAVIIAIISALQNIFVTAMGLWVAWHSRPPSNGQGKNGKGPNAPGPS